MPALHTAAAALAAADMNVELAVNRPTGNLDLVLMVDVGLRDEAATVGAGVGERGLVGLVDLLGRLAMRLGAVILARFAAGLFRRGLGGPFRKGRGLALAAATMFVEQTLKLFDLGLEIGHLAFQSKTAKAWC